MKRLLALLFFIALSLIVPGDRECFAKSPDLNPGNDSSMKEQSNTAPEKRVQRKKRTKASKKQKLWFAEMLMRTGDSKGKILSSLKKRYRVEKSGSNWVVKSREAGNVFGYVKFIDGKLASAAKVWASLSDPEAVNMGDSLYNVLSGLTSDEIKHLSITIKSVRKKEYEQKLILFKTLHKHIRLSIYSGRRVNRVEIQEILF